MSDIDPAAVVAKHGDPNWHYQCWCQANTEGTWPCESYRLAEALLIERAKVAELTEAAPWAPQPPVHRHDASCCIVDVPGDDMGDNEGAGQAAPA